MKEPRWDDATELPKTHTYLLTYDMVVSGTVEIEARSEEEAIEALQTGLVNPIDGLTGDKPELIEASITIEGNEECFRC